MAKSRIKKVTAPFPPSPPQAAEPGVRPVPAPHPRRPNRALLAVGLALFVAWQIFLLLLAATKE